MNNYEFTLGMKQISGFGGGYEQTCRDMLKAGLKWLDGHPKAEPEFSDYGATKNEDAKDLRGSILDGLEDCTLAMYEHVLMHVLFIRKNGWQKYVNEMSS